MEARLGCSEAVSKKTPRASDKQRRSALGYKLGSSARSCSDKANSAMRPQDSPLKTKGGAPEKGKNRLLATEEPQGRHKSEGPWAPKAGPTLQKGWGTRKGKSRFLGSSF